MKKNSWSHFHLHGALIEKLPESRARKIRNHDVANVKQSIEADCSPMAHFLRRRPFTVRAMPLSESGWMIAQPASLFAFVIQRFPRVRSPAKNASNPRRKRSLPSII